MADDLLPFPVAMRGYDRDAVAAHVKRLEDTVAQEHAAAEQARKQAAEARAALDNAKETLSESDQPTYQGLGARVEPLRGPAEEQSAGVVNRANPHAQDTIARAN